MIQLDFHCPRFLIVDDNAHMRRIVRQLLHGFGSREIDEAEDGAAGLEAFTGHNPDIIITERAMPIFDVIELTKTIRQPGGNANPFVPIFMLSGHSEKRRVMEARDSGITEFLAKSIAAKALYERILSVVLSPRPFIQTKGYFGPDRRRNVVSNYAAPERRKGPEGSKTIPVAPLDALLQERVKPREPARMTPAEPPYRRPRSRLPPTAHRPELDP
jgi:two-component system, chemotaxis family, chemotaxis protein CheY